MPDAVCRMLTLMCTLVVACPIGTNLGLLHLLWTLASGRLLGARGTLFPGLAGSSGSWRARPFRRTSPCPHASAKKRPRRPISPRDSGGCGVPLPRPPHPRPLPKQPELPQTGELTDSTKVL